MIRAQGARYWGEEGFAMDFGSCANKCLKRWLRERYLPVGKFQGTAYSNDARSVSPLVVVVRETDIAQEAG